MATAKATSNRGRPRTNWMQVGVKIQPTLVARLAWAATQTDQPGRPEAVRRLLDAALPPASPASAQSSPSLQVGDRVRSKQFGTGRVISPPKSNTGRNAYSKTGFGDGVWRVEVSWDAREWGVGNIAVEALDKLES